MARQGQTRQDLSPADLRALQREHDAYQLRLTGANYHVIGQALGITGEGARQCVKRAAAKVRAELEESPADYKLAMIERNQAMKVRLYERALRGDEKAVASVLSLDKELAALIGLYPSKAEAKTRLSPEEVEALDQELLELWRLHVAEEEKKWKRRKD